MKTRTRWSWAALAIATLLASSPAWGQPVTAQSPMMKPIVTQDGMPPPPSEKESVLSHTEQAEEESCPGGLFGSVEYLYLKPRRRALDFAILDPADNGAAEGQIRSLNWEARSGIRAGIGYRLPGNGWEAGFVYTYLHSAIDGGVVSPVNGTLYATLTHPGTVEQVAAASASTSLNYNVFDGEIAKRWAITESTALRLFGGPRFARIDQNFNAFYNGIDANRDQVTSRLNFDGYGLRLGGEGHWKVWRGLGLYGRAAGSLVVGDFGVCLTETNNAGATRIANVHESFQKVVPVLELSAGVAWQWRNWRFSAGYEVTNWFGLVDTPDFADDVHQGKYLRRSSDLSLDGLAIKAELGF